jgi:hypothetical protein
MTGSFFFAAYYLLLIEYAKIDAYGVVKQRYRPLSTSPASFALSSKLGGQQLQLLEFLTLLPDHHTLRWRFGVSC